MSHRAPTSITWGLPDNDDAGYAAYTPCHSDTQAAGTEAAPRGRMHRLRLHKCRPHSTCRLSTHREASSALFSRVGRQHCSQLGQHAARPLLLVPFLLSFYCAHLCPMTSPVPASPSCALLVSSRRRTMPSAGLSAGGGRCWVMLLLLLLLLAHAAGLPYSAPINIAVLWPYDLDVNHAAVSAATHNSPQHFQRYRYCCHQVGSDGLPLACFLT